MYVILDHIVTAQNWLLAQTAAPVVVEPTGTLSGGIIYTLVIGLIVGVIAKFLTPGRDPGGCIITSLIGIGGAFLAYFIGSMFGWYGNGRTPGIIASIIGAVLLLVIYHAIVGRRGRPQ
jgi:uncharacterized membrane protein YeaQ/YmgE (transglycosylase-associated protein family)